MRVAIVHYWLLDRRGGEAVVDALCRLLPEADIFTLFYNPGRASETVRSHRVTASFLNPLRRWHRSLLPLMPLALESFDLSGYDLIVSSESGPAKGVLVPSGARHVCYCHTPMRYLWDLYAEYLREWTPAWKRPLFAAFAGRLRQWDYSTAARVDEFVANSQNVRGRIWRCYRRDAAVVYPPVAIERFCWKPPEDYYLIVSHLVPYKRVDVAVRCFSANGRRLRVVGDGPEYRRLRALAAPNVEFCGYVPNRDLAGLYARCRALVLPGEEDFGITPVEAMASGKPVIAYGRGGVLESVPENDPVAGFFYPAPDERSLDAALARFEQSEHLVRPGDLRRAAERFSTANFEARMRETLGLPQ
jgi:glycosyltransferase involved in cell wall biosynthesis